MSTANSGSSNLPLDPTIAFAASTQAESSPPRELPAADSPAMKHALQVCGQVFPGSAVEVEIMEDPDELDRSWYSVNVDWPGDVRDCVDRTKRWYAAFEALHPESLLDFVISVTPV